MYADEIARIKADLGIDNLEIEWKWVNKKYLNTRNHWTGQHTFALGRHKIEVCYQGWKYEDVVKIIAHELRHAWQFSTKTCASEMVETRRAGRLRLKMVYKWTGTQYCGPREAYTRSQVKYRQRPEEIDAYAYQDEAWKRMFAQAAPKKKALTPASSLALMFGTALDAR